MPAERAYTRATGRAVILKVAPVDPYNILSGYYVTLNYDISRRESFPDAPKTYQDRQVYAVIEEQADGLWTPVSLSAEQPQNLPANRVFIRGREDWLGIKYGIEEFYIPEDKRLEIEQDLQKNMDKARVEIRVTSSGRAALVHLVIDDRVYE